MRVWLGRNKVRLVALLVSSALDSADEMWQGYDFYMIHTDLPFSFLASRNGLDTTRLDSTGLEFVITPIALNTLREPEERKVWNRRIVWSFYCILYLSTIMRNCIKCQDTLRSVVSERTELIRLFPTQHLPSPPSPPPA